MSVKVMGAVWDLEAWQIEPNEKYVLLAYADHADHAGKNVFPSIELVAKKTGYDERSIQRITRRLEAKGFLIADGGQAGGRGTSAHWRIPINGDKLSPIPTGERVTTTTLKGDTREAEIPVKGDNLSPESLTTITSTTEEEDLSENPAMAILRRAIDAAFPVMNAKRRQFELDLSRSRITQRGGDIVIIMRERALAEAWQETAGLLLERALVGILKMEIKILFMTEEAANA